MQTCIGPSEEHVNMAGIPTEASILQMVEKAMPGRLLNVYAHSSGGGKYMAVLQFKKSQPVMKDGKGKPLSSPSQLFQNLSM
jgi:3-polyprenyl-4-hydroxybenzoate decarboxylase